MESHQVVGAVLVVAGVVDGLMAVWLPPRIADERQRAIVRLALLASGLVVTALGGLFLAGLLGGAR